MLEKSVEKICPWKMLLDSFDFVVPKNCAINITSIKAMLHMDGWIIAIPLENIINSLIFVGVFPDFSKYQKSFHFSAKKQINLI